MVPPDSDRAPPTPPYSGSRLGWGAFRVRGCHPLRPAFPGKFRYTPFVLDAGPTTPGAPRRPRFGLAPFRSPLLGGSLLFSFPPATWMFRFAGFASVPRRMPCLRMAGCPIRVSADLWLLAPPRGISLPAAPFFAPGSHGHPPCALVRSLAAGHHCPRPSAPSCILSLGAASRGPRSRVSRVSCSFVVSSKSCVLLSSLSHPVNEPSRLYAACVENVGLEPTTPGLQSRCSSQLSQSPALITCSPGQTRTADPHIISVVL